jgi:site-specific DNA-adenine methylase
MFSYYGSKSKIVQYYPSPTHDKIIEPFAGSARYSLRYFEKDILLVDKYKVIVDIWHYLQRASQKDILGLPRLTKGMDIRTLNLSKEEILFIGYLNAHGISVPQYKVGNFNSMDSDLKRISKDLFKIKHWKIIHGNYEDLENGYATWFVDPPYQFGGHKYKESNKNLDFISLSNWCRTRQGQVIVCENTKADWLDFKPVIQMQGSMFKTTEAIWTNFSTQYDNVQLELFFGGGK